MQRNAHNEGAQKSSYTVSISIVNKISNDVLLTVCNDCVDPGHPFAREGEHDVAILEFGCHYKRGRTLHPKESHPRDPGEEKVSGKKKARK